MKDTLQENKFWFSKFQHFYKDDILEEDPLLDEPDPNTIDTMPISDTAAVDNTKTEENIDSVLVPEGGELKD